MPVTYKLIANRLNTILFILSRSRLGAMMIGWSFATLNALIPLDRLHETELVVAFHHPRPSHPTHILIVPKRRIKSLLALTESDLPIVQDVITTAQHLAKTLALDETGFSLLVNGGAYQDVMQLHWHLISRETQ